MEKWFDSLWQLVNYSTIATVIAENVINSDILMTSYIILFIYLDSLKGKKVKYT